MYSDNPEELVSMMIEHLDELYYELHKDIALKKKLVYR